MAKGRKQDIGDIIRDAMNGQRPKKKLLPKKVNPTAERRGPRAEFTKPKVEGQKPAYNVQPRKGANSDEGNQDLRNVPYNLRPMPSRSKQKPKRNKPKAAPKRVAKY
jgi:hypothetical protein